MTINGVFANARERRAVSAGDGVFTAGDAGHEMFGVITGAVELRKGDHIVATVGPDETFSEMAIISDAPRSLTAVATAESALAVIDHRMFLFPVHETPTFALQGMRTLADLIRETDALH